RITAEDTPPHAVAENNRLGESLCVIFRAEYAADLGLRAEHREIVRTDGEEFDTLRLAAPGQVATYRPGCRDLIEHIGPRRQVPEFGHGHPDVAHARSASVIDYAHQPLGIVER